MLAGVVDVGRLLIGARESELSGSVQRVELQGVLEGVDGLGKLFRLHVDRAQEIPSVGIIRIQIDDVVKRINRGLSVARILCEQAEVVPRVRIFRVLL